MSLKIISKPDLLKIISNLTFTKSEMQEVGESARKLIVSRTKSGKDVRDITFAKYAEKTRKNGIPDLTDKGDMLNSLVVDAVENKAVISMKNSTENDKGRYHQDGTTKMPQREWFGLSKSDINKLISNTVMPIIKRKVK